MTRPVHRADLAANPGEALGASTVACPYISVLRLYCRLKTAYRLYLFFASD
jgi:hypothetical protein